MNQNNSIDDLFKGLKDFESKPKKGSWNQIANSLGSTGNFMKFDVTKFNVFYASAIAIGVITSFTFELLQFANHQNNPIELKNEIIFDTIFIYDTINFIDTIEISKNSDEPIQTKRKPNKPLLQPNQSYEVPLNQEDSNLSASILPVTEIDTNTNLDQNVTSKKVITRKKVIRKQNVVIKKD